MIKFVALICTLLLYGHPVAANQEYRFIVMNPVGSGADQVARRISRLVKEQHNVTLIVNNIGAAGGMLAAQQFKQERLAVVMANTSMLIYGPLAGNNDLAKTYNINDFNIIADLGLAASVWYTWSGSGINTPFDLIKVLPTLSNASIGVASQDTMTNARALVALKKLDLPVVMFKNHNETLTAVAGRHTTVGVAIMGTDSVWSLAEKGDIKILGYSNTTAMQYRGHDLLPMSRMLDLPSFYGGSWIAITPGDGKEHRQLRIAIESVMKDRELQTLIRQTWPLAQSVPFDHVHNTAKQYQHLMR